MGVQGDSGLRLSVVVAVGLGDRPRLSVTHYRRRSMSLRLRWRCLRGLRPFRSSVVVAGVRDRKTSTGAPSKPFAPDVDDHRDQHEKGGEHLLEPSTRSISRRCRIAQFYSKAPWDSRGE